MKLLLTIALLAPLALTGAQGPSAVKHAASNAAVKYLRANIALRQAYALPPDAAANLQKALDAPLNSEDERLVKAADEALVEFHHAAALKQCEWAMSVEDGPDANTSHRGAMTELISVAGIRARLRFRNGDSEGAINDLVAAMAATRHFSTDGSIASVLFAYKLEKPIAAIIAQNLHRLSPAQLKRLAAGLDALPRGSTIADALNAEKMGRNDLLAIADRAKTRDELIDALLKGAPILQSDKTVAAKIVDGCGGLVQGFVSCVGEQGLFYSKWIARFALPPERFETEYKADVQERAKKNPVIREFTPALARFRWAEAYCQTRRALLRAAVAVQSDGRNALGQHVDPYDENTFAYVLVEGGFRLESQLQENGTPVSLAVPSSREP